MGAKDGVHDQMTDEVIVVGGGPVGLVAALTLATEGVPVTVIEAEHGLSRKSSASVFHPAILELLEPFGVTKRLVPLGTSADRIQYRDYYEGEYVHFDYELIGDRTRYPFRLHIEQWELTRIVYGLLSGFDNVRILFGKRAVDVVTGPQHVEVRCHDGTALKASWLIAADGAHSAVRKSLGIHLEGSTYTLANMSIKTTADLRTVLPDIAPITYISGGPSDVSPFGIAALAHPDHWRISCRVPFRNDEVRSLLEPDALEAFLHGDALDAFLRGTLSDEIQHYPILAAYSYRTHRRVAQRFSQDRVALVGDAAHLNSPAGGMGMNSGIQDAYYLAKCVAGVLTGDRDESEVVDIAAWRRAVAIEIVGPRAEGNFSEQFDPEVVETRRQRLLELSDDRQKATTYLAQRSMLDLRGAPSLPATA